MGQANHALDGSTDPTVGSGNFEGKRAAHFGRPFAKRFALCYRTVLCPVLSLSVLSVCNVDVLWPKGWMDQGETWQGGRSRPRLHCVR